MKILFSFMLVWLIALLLAGCSMNSRDQLLKTDASQVQLRNIQTRVYDSSNKNKTLRSVVATLQDLGFVIDKADQILGTVSATKLDGYQLRMTVVVRPRGATQQSVRANAQYNLKSVEHPGIYQDFFTVLSKSMFLTAHTVE